MNINISHKNLRKAPWLLAAMLLLPGIVGGSPLSVQVENRIASGQATWVIVEIDGSTADSEASAERTRRHIVRDDIAVLNIRARGYRQVKSEIEASLTAADAAPVRDYTHLPLSVWRVSSAAALQRLRGHPAVRAIHQNSILRPVSVSDLAFINQAQAAQVGATGAGTTIAVIDGGLGNNYLNYSDFGTCTAVDTPAAACRVVVNQDFYPGASAETVHGTNVSAIALGVAPGANLAMYDVFNGASASTVDVLTAINDVITAQATYNIVAINLSLGDGTTHSQQCSTSAFRTAINNARNAGITVVAAAGNSGSKTGLGDPACVANAVSVGAVYDNSYGNITWVASADSNGQCTDVSAADHVTCFSQSASYLSLLAPGTFVNAPSSAFQQSGTSQATPHVTGSVAVLRAKYPAESLDQTLQRLKLSGVNDTDTANGISTPRLNLYAAVTLGTQLVLNGSGPVSATSGSKATYSLTVTNNGPLVATGVVVTDSLPAGASVTSLSSGCAVNGSTVTCSVASVAVNTSMTFTVNVSWNINGAVFDSASVIADQSNSALPSQQTIGIGTPPGMIADAPFPVWAWMLLAVTLAFSFTSVNAHQRL